MTVDGDTPLLRVLRVAYPLTEKRFADMVAETEAPKAAALLQEGNITRVPIPPVV